MRNSSILLVLLVLATTACNSVVCDTGTIDRNGKCQPGDVNTNPAMCGPFTELQGNMCVPKFPPTVCDPTTTTADTDITTGVTTCIGTGGGGCSSPFACPQPTAGNKQTICGRFYDFETMTAFSASGATGAMCTSPTNGGPCSLVIRAYDAIAFGSNPGTAQPLVNGGVDIDDCGRYRVKDIVVPSGPFIGLGIDDALALGSGGSTVTVGVATIDNAGQATKDLEAFVVPMSTTTKWETSGGPALSTGYYVPVFRQHKSMGDLFAPAAGVTFTRSTGTATAQYFTAAETTHTTVDPVATVTGANGTALVIGAKVADSLAYSGTGGITDTVNCQWETKAGATLANIVFVQVFRPTNQIGKTCPL